LSIWLLLEVAVELEGTVLVGLAGLERVVDYL
jgi:hypothetical protein